MPPNDTKLHHLKSQATLHEHHFHSALPVIGPLIAWFRERWNRVATKWYIRPLIQQQSEFNQQVADLLSEQSQVVQQLEAQVARLNQQRDALTARVAQLADEIAAQATRKETRITTLTARSAEHDAWLSDQDRDQVLLTRSQAESAAQLIQIARDLDELKQRLAQCEPPHGMAESSE